MLASQTARPTAWNLDGFVASDRSARLDLESPATGIIVPGACGEDHLLGLDLRVPPNVAVPLADHWLRGADVVAVYRPGDPRRLEATAMWRRLASDCRVWELVLSAQTALVESDGSLAVTCDVASGDVTVGRVDEGTLQWSPIDRATSCPPDATNLLVRRAHDAVLVAAHPADARRIVATPRDGHLHIACWLFSAAIEKGVLHRGRVLAAIGPKDTTTWADALIAEFVVSPPPLTT
jgi:hypothetical protein